MASVFTRPNTRFWQIKYRDPATGRIMRKSTGIDVVLPDARRRAKRLEAEWTQREMAAPRTRERERWEAWADAYFVERYENTGSLKNARLAVCDLLAYFREREVRTPRQVDYRVAADFIPWRISNKGLRAIRVNSAKLRFVYLNVLMSEAVRRGFADANPCREVKVRRTPAKEKLEITPEHEAFIEMELASKPRWMRDQWLVLMRQGCRVAETAVPLDRVNTEAKAITLRLKGGKLHTQELHPDLLPLIAEAVADGRRALVEGPPSGSWPAIWSDFFKRRKLPYSIHCTRVTVITRLIRAGHNPVRICNFIGHSEAVNRIYRKLKPADSRALLDTLAGAPSPAAGNATP